MSQSSAISRRQGNEIATGTFRDAALVNQTMEIAQAQAHLISPATSVGAMPEGCGIAISKVVVDKADTYSTGGGKFGLSKTVLQKIGAALGVSWDAAASGRVDDGRDPYYCNWKAVGSYRSFDGQLQTIVGSKEMDLRDGSPQIVGMHEKANAKDDGRKTAHAQIRELRLHIQSHAETKAQLRALRSMGIKTGYTAEELQLPFVAVRVMFTGQTQNPELRRMFAEKLADSFLDSQRSLYGSPAVQASQPMRLSAPPVGSVRDDDDDYDTGYMTERSAPTVETNAVPMREPERKEPERKEAEAKPAQAQSSTSNRSSGHKMPFGRSKDKAIEDAATGDLEWMANVIAEKLDNGDSRFKEKDQAFLDALHAEIARREQDRGL